MQFMGKGNGDSGDGEGKEFRNAMQEAVEKAQAAELITKMMAFVGSGIGYAFALFVVPFLIVYAYNGLQPAVWPDISYLPTVVGLFVFRVLIHMLRRE